jgi:hypothetical protein
VPQFEIRLEQLVNIAPSIDVGDNDDCFSNEKEYAVRPNARRPFIDSHQRLGVQYVQRITGYIVQLLANAFLSGLI